MRRPDEATAAELAEAAEAEVAGEEEVEDEHEEDLEEVLERHYGIASAEPGLVRGSSSAAP